MGIKEEPKPPQPQAIKPLQPPPPSSPSLPSLDQLIMMREQEMQMLYQSLIKQGNTEQMATYVASQMANERYKAAIDAVLQMNNERPSSRDLGGHHDNAFNAPMAHSHSRHPDPYVHDPYNRAAAAAAAAMINLNNSAPGGHPPPTSQRQP